MKSFRYQLWWVFELVVTVFIYLFAFTVGVNAIASAVLRVVNR